MKISVLTAPFAIDSTLSSSFNEQATEIKRSRDLAGVHRTSVNRVLIDMKACEEGSSFEMIVAALLIDSVRL